MALSKGVLAKRGESLMALPASGREFLVTKGELAMGPYCLLSTPWGLGRRDCQGQACLY